MDRRALFFLGSAVVCALLIPVTEQAQRWVPAALTVVYVILSVASWADRRTRNQVRAADDPGHGP
jgi:heme A synthase